jgi:hypothetical protein
MSGWQAGAASTTFDIPEGTPLAGYMARAGGSSGTLDPLRITALALGTPDHELVVVSVDILGVDGALVREIEQASGIAPGWLAVCASHTHSGPARISRQRQSEPDTVIDRPLRARFVEACASLISQARRCAAEAVLTYAVAEAAGVSANRNAPDGRFDPLVHVLRAQHPGGQAIATLVHFACHPTILPASSNLVSAEFPGALRNALDVTEFGTVLFANGAAGDVSTRFTRHSQDVAEVDRVGRVLATAVRRVLNDGREQPPVLDLRTIDVELPMRNPAEMRAIIADARSKLDGIALDSLTPGERRIAETRAQGIAILEQILAQLPERPLEVVISEWRIGELIATGIPGELFASLGELCTQGDDRRLILGYTNGYLGYFADRAAYDDGLYEALASPFAPGASEAMVARLLGSQ